MTEQSPTLTPEEADAQWKAVCMKWCRAERDKALAATDYIHLPDVTVSDEYAASMATYRQQLRDFPSTWSATYDAMTAEEKNGITDTSIRMALPAKP